MLPSHCGPCLTFSTLSTLPCSYELPFDPFLGTPASLPQDSAILAAEELCAIGLGEDVRFMTLMTGGSHLGRIVVEMPMVVGQRQKGCDGVNDGEGVVIKVAEYVKDGNGWTCVEMKERVKDRGKGKSAGRAGESVSIGMQVTRWTRPVVVVIGKWEEHGLTMKVVIGELS